MFDDIKEELLQGFQDELEKFENKQKFQTIILDFLFCCFKPFQYLVFFLVLIIIVNIILNIINLSISIHRFFP